eukprot:s2006_g12.t1
MWRTTETARLVDDVVILFSSHRLFCTKAGDLQGESRRKLRKLHVHVMPIPPYTPPLRSACVASAVTTVEDADGDKRLVMLAVARWWVKVARAVKVVMV